MKAYALLLALALAIFVGSRFWAGAFFPDLGRKLKFVLEFDYGMFRNPPLPALPPGFRELKEGIAAKLAPGAHLGFITDDASLEGRTYKLQMLQYEISPFLLSAGADTAYVAGFFDNPDLQSHPGLTEIFRLGPYSLFERERRS